jgi:ferredoxin-NADP reductase
MENIVKVRSVEMATHDVLRITIEKPMHYSFSPGQATEIGINKEGWQKELRPFTFTCLPDDDHLEFTIKTYPSHKGVTNELLSLKPNDELILGDSWGTIGYKGEGVFIAGGAGVTPFISIFRSLHSKNKIGNNKLIFANNTKADIINESEFRKLLGKNFINVLSMEKADGYEHGFITEDILKQHVTEKGILVYLCGPEPMMKAIETQLFNLGVGSEAIVKEEF